MSTQLVWVSSGVDKDHRFRDIQVLRAWLFALDELLSLARGERPAIAHRGRWIR